MVTITFTNSKSGKEEIFEPINPQNVRLYVCGPTVYDRAHLGNARPVVVFDILYRLLQHVFGKQNVSYARNITDIDDKIIERAGIENVAIDVLTRTTHRWFRDDMAELGVDYRDDPRFFEPRATEYIDEMLRMITGLIAQGHAYEAERHVLFSVESYSDYGCFSGRSVEDMIAGSRVEVAPYKKNPMDFVLWKPSADDQPGWESPWGFGRPGWHIECSAMSHALLGESFDIHGGGADLKFPHHENEIAQSKCFSPNSDFARYWLHNEMLQVDGKKMAKSVGNFFTVRDLLDQSIPGEVIRFVLMSTHYRKPMDWTQKKIRDARTILRKWHDMTMDVSAGTPPHAIVEALASDLNTAAALAELHRLASEGDVQGLKSGADFLGLLQSGSDGWLNADPENVDSRLVEKVEYWINRRAAARADKNYSRADEIRANLASIGIMITDSPNGTTWEQDLEHEHLGNWEMLE